MKPRIYWWRGVWNCKSLTDKWMALGMGYTPKQAYEEWQKIRKCPSLQPFKPGEPLKWSWDLPP